jgi:hypothetical protein
MTKRTRRSFLKDTFRTLAIGAGGLTASLSATPAQACAIYCRYLYWDNNTQSNCFMQNVFRCTSACGGSFRYCASRPGRNFCMSRNAC